MATRISGLFLLIILFNNAQTEPRLESMTKTVSSKDSKHEETPSQRGLIAGDIFTPYEMLPITEKLINKVEKPGQGKGIVSSATSPEELADKLFEAFFFTDVRIVKLQDFDITGLDALQALALSGEVANIRNANRVTNEMLQTTLSYRGQNIILDQKPKTSHYKLVTKTIENYKEIKRRGIKLATKLAKKKHLIINKNRRHFNENVKNNEQIANTMKVATTRKTTLKKTNNNSMKKINIKDGANKIKKHAVRINKAVKLKKKKADATCRWQYECSNPADLDTCRLHTKCMKKETIKTTPEFISTKQKPDKQSLAINQFRKMLESRILRLKPQNMDNKSERLESLTEYFEKIIMAKFLRGSTTPMSIQETNGKNPRDKAHAWPDNKNEEYPRRILGIPTKITYKTKSNK
ncbi:uncharacterized protein LOC116412767 isoform X2 [Galleria mellonella]|uniref:Uncharacterized protein LOC116412767 isoform X2 n=1 Tax=Galleria mellonella TaxID=7137 RepID=A0ABM3M886_GALME|nr:uncharacterized protein LOC116412767 isoform X2 [Galleria mellonella]